MKALTLTQPWASLVAEGHKRIETRSWGTSYRGPLAIHAAKTMPTWVIEALEDGLLDDLRRYAPGLVESDRLNRLPLGAIVAVCKLTDCSPTTATTRDWVRTVSPGDEPFGDFSPGRFMWILDDVIPLKTPIPMRGYQGLWDAPIPLVGAGMNLAGKGI